MNSKFISFLAGVVVAGGVMGALLFRRSSNTTPVETSTAAAGESQAASAHSDLEAKLAAADAKLADLQAENVRLRGKLAGQTVASNSAARKKPNTGAGAMADMISALGGGGETNGEPSALQQMIQAQMETQINGQIAQMKSRLNLTPEQETSIRLFLQNQMKAGSELGMKMLSGSATQEEIEAAQKTVSGVTDINLLLSPEQRVEYTKMQTEEKQNGARLMANQNLLQVQSTLGLTQEQQDKLYSVFYDSAFSTLGGNSGGEGQASSPLDLRGRMEKEVAAMKGILTPEQIDQYRALQEQQINMVESIMKKGGK
ncbi:MAG TPA: hypothetical protein VMF06_11660 [Candidatus Limnocylindria bacterium]|jgi:hypothetical protein|nr:hypothetical protein [Candidatus Limnocylindria bacterium]